jgi:hypothetical protein
MISLITTATNPFSNNYLTFYACINSFAKIVDELIVVSGGTIDGSFKSELITNEAKKKLIIVENNKTYWDYEKDFSSNQINNMINEGLKICNSNWAIVSWSDYVLNAASKASVIQELNDNKDEYWLKYNRRFNYFGNQIRDNKISAILNLKKIEQKIKSRSLYGLSDISKVIYDYPIIPQYGYLEKTIKGRDVNNIIMGPPLEGGNKTSKSFSVNVYQHYFYSYKQLINQKYNFYKIFWSRQRGEYIKSKKEISATFGIDKGVYGDKFYRKSINEMLKSDMHINMIPLIECYYSKGMLGGFFQGNLKNKKFISKAKEVAYKFNKKLQNINLKNKRLKGIIKYADIKNIKEICGSVPIDLKEIWQEQDKVYFN